MTEVMEREVGFKIHNPAAKAASTDAKGKASVYDLNSKVTAVDERRPAPLAG